MARHYSASVRFSNYESYEQTLSVIIQHIDIKPETAETRYQPPFLFRHVTRCRRRGFRHASHCSIGPGPELGPGSELGQVQWRDGRYSHWFNKYYGARHRSCWPDLGDPGPCSRRKQDGGSHSTAGASFWAQAMASEATPIRAFLPRCSARMMGMSNTAQILQASRLK